jgi:hypothetical protein
MPYAQLVKFKIAPLVLPLSGILSAVVFLLLTTQSRVRPFLDRRKTK